MRPPRTHGAGPPWLVCPLPPPPLPPRGGAAVPFDYGGGVAAGQGGEYAVVGFSYSGQGEQQWGEEEWEDEYDEEGAEGQDTEGTWLQEAQQAAVEQQAQGEAEDNLPFVPPFMAPERLLGHMPGSRRQYQAS